MLDNIRIVLVNPSHPGNIGAVARAMKTMELKHLYLVSPKEFPSVNATAMAAGADDILANAIVTNSLEHALVNTTIVFATSARLRALQLPPLDPKNAAKIIAQESNHHQIAVLFGRENNGLSNEELAMCNYHIYIPSNPNFSSLNIAAAAQLITYEIKMASQPNENINTPETDLATVQETQALYKHLEQTLTAINFLYPDNRTGLMAKLKRLFNKSKLEKNEVGILRGILTTINSKILK